ncbi:hypothetical protein ACFWP5_29545 [Streptomyces sp. NPDC058469]|uniref:hypothetical protein n=1 Tax=Streptomyces sp. NPDC058469 TaxID=3346514 RepID=UPI00365F2689
MGLREVQTFLSTYMRDQDLRRRYRTGESDVLEDGMRLEAEDRRLIGRIEFDKLDERAEGILSERLGRTTAIFTLFLEHLARYADVERVYRDFDRQWKSQWWQRSREIRRFEAFAFEYVVANELPDYLIDLSRLCAQATLVAESPKVWTGVPGASVTGHTVRGNDRVELRGPYEVLDLRHDVVRIMDDPNGYGAVPGPIATRVLVQRDWQQHKRSRIVRLSDEPVLRALTEGSGTIQELGGRLPELPYSALYSAVADLYREQIVHLVNAPELDGAPTPIPTTPAVNEGR